MTFIEVKNQYEKLREKERMAIRDHLANMGFKVSMNHKAGKGLDNYTSSKRIKPYNLKNWKYICATTKDGKKNIFVSLQAFDHDLCSHNCHVLYDRIGLYAYEKYNADEVVNKMLTTNIDLPMNDAKLAELDALIDKLIS